MLVLKGIIIGIGKIIPGVSGSLLAISMGLYPKMIDSINYFFDNKRDNFKFLFKIGIGVLISIVFFSNIIIYALNNYYLITMFFFIGLILGSMNDIKNNLDNILAIVIRYFGGIKLGAGGLVRAYSNSITNALNLTEIISLTFGYLVELEFAYDQIKLVDYILNDKKIISKEYNSNIIYKFYLDENELNFIPELEKVAIHLSLKDKVLIKKD